MLARTRLKPYMRPLVVAWLAGMQTSRTDKYVYRFAYFLLLAMAIDVAGMGPDYVIWTVEDIQPHACSGFVAGAGLTASLWLWSQVLKGFVISQVAKMPHKDRKVVGVGSTKMWTEWCDALGACLSELGCPSPSCLVFSLALTRPPTVFTALVKLFSEPQDLV